MVLRHYTAFDLKRDCITVRKLAIAAAVSLSLSSMTNVSHALGLGEIEMYSALNQNLDAEIAILSATEDELQSLQVRLAPASAFARAGLQLSPVLSSVDFTVDRRPDGQAVVKATSSTPVLEPFLNFLLEVDAPGNVKLVREYTVLLNPPSFTANEPVRQPAGRSSSADVFVSNDNAGAGVPIDLSGNPTASLPGNTIGEVTFTETAIATSANSRRATSVAPVVTKETENLFVPDSRALATNSATTVVDNDGQVISLVQELQTTPQFDTPALADNAGESVPLDNLGAQVPAGSAVFGNEFEADQFSDTAADQGDLISSAELAELVSDVATFSDPVVELSQAPFGDTDAQGDLIDLSGELFGTTQTTTDDAGFSTGSVAVAIDGSARSGASGAGSSAIIDLSGETYRIRTEDTLWSVANAQKAPGVSPHQMMVALLNANPDAFRDGNMNRMRSGALLQIPTPESQTSVDRRNALAIVESWTRNNRPPQVDTGSGSFAQPEDTEIAFENSTSDLGSSLDDINQRFESVQAEIASDAIERDDLQGRFDNLSDNMQEMKSLITVRESELMKLQDEVAAAESNAAAIDAQISELSNASENVTAMQKGLNEELELAQRAIARQADADTNLATAEAEAQAVRLSSEEEALRSQLAALELEKRELEASSQLERAALVREAEEEKSRLLAQAQTERENIRAELEAEKARISQEAELEIARVRGEAELENQRLIQQAEEERAQVLADSQQLQAQLDQAEADKASLMEKAQQLQAEGTAMLDSSSEGASRVKDRLAELQQSGGEAAENAGDAMSDKADNMMADGKQAMADTKAAMSDSDADGEGVMAGAADTMSDAGKTMASGGAAAVGGLLGFAPLQDLVGNRKTVLAAGAGLSLLGLLGAWGFRRRKTEPTETKVLRPRNDEHSAVSPSVRDRKASESAMYDEPDNAAFQPKRRESSSAAAAAAAAAAAVTGTAAVATSRGTDADNDNSAQDSAATPGKAQSYARDAQTPETTTPLPEQSTVPLQSATGPANDPVKSAPLVADAQNEVDQELEETALDDTLTEAEVYLRYGLHGQAEDLLKTAIERSPNNEEYHFKLLENYHDQKNSDNFNELAGRFTEKFPNSGHHARIAEMRDELASNSSTGTDASGSGLGAAGALAAGASGAAAMAAGAASDAKGAASDGLDALHSSHASRDLDTTADDLLDQTIDPGSEFSLDELQATGNLGSLAGEADLNDQGGLSLDDVDLASLDDDGTMNLEDIAGDQMSGDDLGTLNLTNPDFDTSFENMSLEDVDLGAPGSIDGGFANELDLTNDNNATIAGGSDEMETMLDLAKAYMDMGDDENAAKALRDIAARGNPLQQTEAAELLKKLNK